MSGISVRFAAPDIELEVFVKTMPSLREGIIFIYYVTFCPNEKYYICKGVKYGQ